MAKRTLVASWARAFGLGLAAVNRQARRAGHRALMQALQVPSARAVRKATAGRVKPVGPSARRTAAPTAPVTPAYDSAYDSAYDPAGDWLQGLAVSAGETRRFYLYRPAAVQPSERLPLLVMLHGCGQTAEAFALSTRMNRLAARERFLVLYPEQDRRANSQGCWNWFATRSGRAWAEVELIMNAVDQACQDQPVDRERVAVAGLSAGASMAALLATRHADRFKAVVMHSGVPPGAASSAISALRAMRGQRAAEPVAAPLPASLPAPPWPPLLVIHGRLDTVVDASNGRAAAVLWATAAGARAMAGRLLQRGRRYPMNVSDFKNGARTAARLVEVDRLGHAWSGGAASQAFGDGGGPDASGLLWTFVARQFQAAGAPGRRRASPVAPL